MIGWWVAARAQEPPRIVPVEVTTDIRIDGVLDEPVWQTEPLTGLFEWKPVPGTPDWGTRVWVAYDDRFLYLAFDARIEAGRPQSNALSPRDRNRGEDTVGVLLDTYRDRHRAFLFLVNGRGVQGDTIFVDGETAIRFPQDMSWDAVFQSAGQPDGDRYRVEMAIPFRSLRFPQTDEQTWGIVLLQNVAVPFSVFTWPRLDPNTAGLLTQAATLGPFPVRARPSRLELLPTLTGIVGIQPPDARVDPGIAARIGLTSSMTAELTVNPDFSQIESDVDQVSANVKFPLFFPERRPFFLENADLFSTPITLVHTRSVVDPAVGYKVSGRAGRLAANWLGAWDQNPAPSTIFLDYATGEPRPGWGPTDVEGADAVDHLIRGRVDLGGGSAVGVLLTDKELIRPDRADLANRVLALDGELNVGRYTLTGLASASSTDLSNGHTLAAPAWTVAARRQGERWVFDLAHDHSGAEYRAENGFLTEVGRTGFSGSTSVLFRPDGAVRYAAPGPDAAVSLTPDGAVAFGHAGGHLDLNLGDRWTVAWEAGYQRERFWKVDFDDWYNNLSVDVQPIPAWYLGADVAVGTLPHYAAATPADLYRGFHWFVGPRTNADVFHRLNLDGQVAIDLFGPSAFGEPAYRTVIPRGAALLTLTPRWSARVIEQYDSFARDLQSSALLAYEVNYGTAVYAGYSESVGLDRGADPVRTAFAKITYLARP